MIFSIWKSKCPGAYICRLYLLRLELKCRFKWFSSSIMQSTLFTPAFFTLFYSLALFFFAGVLLYCLVCLLKILILLFMLDSKSYWLFSWKNFKQLRNLFFIHSGCIFKGEINRKWSCNSFHLTVSQRWIINASLQKVCLHLFLKLWKLSRFLYNRIIHAQSRDVAMEIRVQDTRWAVFVREMFSMFLSNYLFISHSSKTFDDMYRSHGSSRN